MSTGPIGSIWMAIFKGAGKDTGSGSQIQLPHTWQGAEPGSMAGVTGKRFR
jgi:hypothetical protein